MGDQPGRRRALRPRRAADVARAARGRTVRRHVSHRAAHLLHAVSIDEPAGTATGYLSPPSRSGGKLFNFNAINSWTNVHRQCLHEGEIDYRDGWRWGSVANLADELRLGREPVRCLHTCFMRRSSREREGTVWLNPIEAHTHRRDALGRAKLFVRGLGRRREDVPWKLEKYRRGPVVTKDVKAFLGVPARS